jgi:hypothetical protein
MRRWTYDGALRGTDMCGDGFIARNKFVSLRSRTCGYLNCEKGFTA